MDSAMPVSRSVSPPQAIAFFACRTATGPFSAIVAASSAAFARACPFGTRWFTRPTARASWAPPRAVP